MLILTRRFGEKLVVDDKTVISVLGAEGGKIRLGIEAPKEVEVYREEVFKRIQQEKHREIETAEVA